MLPGGESGGVAFFPDGKFFAAAAGESDSHIETSGKLRQRRRDAPPLLQLSAVRCMAFTTGSDLLVTGMADTTALIWAWRSKH